MPFLNPPNRRFLSAVSNLLYSNPFLSDILNYERQALGAEALDDEPIWSMTVSDPDRVRANTWRIVDRLQPLLERLRASLAPGAEAHESDLILYEDGLLYYFYYRYYPQLVLATFRQHGKERSRWLFYREFCDEWNRFFRIRDVRLPTGHQAKHTFACYYRSFEPFITFLSRSSETRSPRPACERPSGNQFLRTTSGDTAERSFRE